MKRAPLNALQQVKEAAGLAESAARPEAEASPAQTPAKQSSSKTSREGKTNITGYFPIEWKNSMRMVQIKTGKTMQDQLEEALTDLFRKHNVPVPTNKEVRK